MSSLWLVTFGVTLLEGEVRALAAAYPGLQPAVAFMIFLGGVLLLALFMFIFPNGRFIPRWTRWVYLVLTLAFLLFSVLEIVDPDLYATIRPGTVAIWFAMLLSGVVIQVYRFLRVSGAIERQQTKWVMFGLLTLPLSFVVYLALSGLRLPFSQSLPTDGVPGFLELTLFPLAFTMIPLTIGVSILRYRLWDTDIIINRTLVYGLLTAVLALLYFGSVLLFQQIMQALTGQNSPLAIVASTLLIAALFTPLRNGLQNLIDRRFYRRKYDAAQTLADFAQVAQEEVDLDNLTAELLAVVQQTMQPEHVSLWLKE